MPNLLRDNLSFRDDVASEYIITMPNMYARGILFGKMVLELGDTCMAKNEKHNLYCDLDFKTKVRNLPKPKKASSHLESCSTNKMSDIIPHLLQTQGFFSGTYNAIAGRVRRNSYEIGEVAGRWSHVMEVKNTKVRGRLSL